MEQKENRKRIDSIYQMLFEMAAGNFNFKIEKTGADDEIEGLILLVNLVAEELRASVLQHGFINSHFSFQYLIQNTFILNQEFLINSYSPDVANSFGYHADELFNAAFKTFLAKDSHNSWELISVSLISDAQYHNTSQLIFKSKNGLLIPAFCTISRLLHSTKILISSVNIVVNEAVRHNPVLLNANNELPSPKRHDAKLIQQLYDYILDNLHSPLPTVKELSNKFATNEHKLKEGFRHFFNTSIYQFYNEERLKRAHLLIQQTNLPLKDIADKAGFGIYNNFSKAFRKRFGYSPNMLLRPEADLKTKTTDREM